jgi:uncharacterized protein (TIGR00297 family)
VIERLAAGGLLAVAVALLARRAGALAASGAAAAVVVGTVCVAAGWSWGALLLAFFVATSALSRLGARRKEARTGAIVAKGGARDARQVLANGGLFALAALLSLVAPWPGWMVLGAGALAASTSDTWGTEVGTLAGGMPRSITTGRPVPPGTSGGISAAGTLAALCGAAFVAVLAWSLRWPGAAAILAGGIVGSTADSLLGATMQSRRWCERCGIGTEREVHGCGSATRPAGGLAWLDNDGVNLASALVGALAALAAALAALSVTT